MNLAVSIVSFNIWLINMLCIRVKNILGVGFLFLIKLFSKGQLNKKHFINGYIYPMRIDIVVKILLIFEQRFLWVVECFGIVERHAEVCNYPYWLELRSMSFYMKRSSYLISG